MRFSKDKTKNRVRGKHDLSVMIALNHVMSDAGYNDPGLPGAWLVPVNTDRNVQISPIAELKRSHLFPRYKPAEVFIAPNEVFAAVNPSARSPGHARCGVSVLATLPPPRRVKLFFREHKQKGELEILTKKPLRAGDAEIAANSRAGGAKLRVANRIK